MLATIAPPTYTSQTTTDKTQRQPPQLEDTQDKDMTTHAAHTTKAERPPQQTKWTKLAAYTTQTNAKTNARTSESH